MKRLLKVVIGVVIVAAVLLVVLVMFAGQIVKNTINIAGPQALGVPMSLNNVTVNLMNGNFGLDGLVIGNPEGFKTPSAIRVQKVAVNVKMASLFARVLVIDRIHVSGPEITYEVGLKGSNIGAIQDKAVPAESNAKQPESVAKPSKESKKVQINDFLIESGAINVSTIGMAGQDITIPLPTIHLVDIGKESNGATPKEVIAKVFGAVGGAISGAASGIGGGAVAVGKGAVEVGKTVGQGASKTLESVGGLLK